MTSQELSTFPDKILFPFVVNYHLEGQEGQQFVCEAPDVDQAMEQCYDAYPGCFIDKVIEKGED